MQYSNFGIYKKNMFVDLVSRCNIFLITCILAFTHISISVMEVIILILFFRKDFSNCSQREIKVDYSLHEFVVLNVKSKYK